jgi:hypothetical protein
VKRIALIAVLVAGLAGCGGSSEPDTYTLAPTKACARSTLHGVLTPEPDFVASTATGGSFHMTFTDNAVTVVFGSDGAEARNLADAYRRFHAKNVGVEDILRTDHNAVLLWKFHPSDAAGAQVAGCLK